MIAELETGPQKVEAMASANIALIKYMGKKSAGKNLPTNSSLSLTLPGFDSKVQIFDSEGNQSDKWAPLEGSGFFNPNLSEAGKEKFLNFFRYLKDLWGLQKNYLIKSGNSFAPDCGLASSASSFAALTKATASLAQSENAKNFDFRDQDLALISKKGSGSSCRSFFSPWAHWKVTDETESILGLDFPDLDFLDMVIEVNPEKKSVSSSDAHRRVPSSLSFLGRAERAELRLEAMTAALRTGNLESVFELAWADFWDMHSLFETSQPSFGYMTPGSMEVLKWTRERWSKFSIGPVATMDAGANVHLLVQKSNFKLIREIQNHWGVRFPVRISHLHEASAEDFV